MTTPTASDFLAGGGEMGALMRSIDWAQTPLGQVEVWPQSLRTALSIMLASRFAMVVAWGPEFRFFYNDRYRPVLGASKHPGALGSPAKEIFPEAWPFIGPLFESTRQGESVALDDVLIPLDRNGYLENCYFTLSYSPIREESGGVGGMLAVVAETTERVEGERRLQTLRVLAQRPTGAKTVEEACKRVAEVLGENPIDAPFALFYLVDDNGKYAHLAAVAGLPVGTEASRAMIDLTKDADQGWPLASVAHNRKSRVVHDLALRFGALPGGPYPEPPHTAVVTPLMRPGQKHPDGLIVLGISPRRRLDERYMTFIELAADQTLTAIGNARAYEDERKRAEALAEIDQAKTAFFSNVSHEFRTPLALMLGPLEDVLSHTNGLPAEDRERLEVAHRNSKRLFKLVNTLLDFSHIEAGRALRESQAHLQLTTEAAQVGAWRWNIKSGEVYWSDIHKKLWGYEPVPGPIRYEDWGRLLDKEDLERAEQAIEKCLQGREEYNVEYRITPLGSTETRWIRSVGRTVYDDEGEAVSILGVSFDITERKRADEKMRQSAQQLALITDTAPIYIEHCDRQERLLFVNKSNAARFGLTPAEIIGKPIAEVIGAEAYEKKRPYIELVLRGEPVEYEIEIPYATIGRRFMHCSSAPEFDSRGNVIGWVSAIADVTARKQAEEALRATELRFTMFMQNLPGLSWIKDPEGRYVYANDAAETAFGMPRAELYGKTDEDLFPPETAAQFRENDRRALAGGAGIQTIETLEQEDGIHHSIVSKFPIFGPDGRPAMIGGVAFDITERMQAEEALREADRRKDEFLAMLAHELRNPLAPIRNAAQVLKLVGADDANQRWAREVIERQTQHLTRLVDDLLDVSRITRGKVTLQCERLNLTTIINRAVETSRPLIDARKHLLTITTPSEPLYVEGDLTRLVQVVGNLLNNAAKYTEEGGMIQLEAAREGGQAVVRVRDNGMGLAADLIPHVFDLFTQADRSLDRSQGGLGIGLTLVRNLVEMHGGEVEAKSDGPGCGSEFAIRLPAMQEEEGEMGLQGESGALDSPPRTPHLRVLLVEDNVDSSEMMAFILRRTGHEVRISHDGQAALEATGSFRPQVVLCDIGLPGMNGFEVAARLREQPSFARTTLIALSGYGQEEDRRRAHAAGFNYYLVKPVDPDALVSLLDSLWEDLQARLN